MPSVRSLALTVSHRSPTPLRAAVAYKLSQVVAMALAMFAAAPSTAAMAAEPATVTVRVEGLAGQTLVPQTQLTTNTNPVPVEGGTCSGTSAGGALFDAVRGNWTARSEPGGVEIDGIGGLNFPSFKEKGDAFWAFWLNNKFAERGACAEEVASGAKIVFVAQCLALGPHCSNATAPHHFLTVSPSFARTVNVGEAVSVTIGSLSTESGAAEALPPAVTLGSGSAAATPNASGVASLTFTGPGTYTLQARAQDSVPSDPVTVCVHNGNDGTCGTSVASQGGSQTAPLQLPLQTLGPGPVLAETASAVGIKNRHVYSRRRAPRVLAGVVSVPAGDTLHDVRIRLERRHRGRCFDFSGPRAAFVRARRCGRARFFSVGAAQSFSYLLPARLGPGRYAYAVEAIENGGRATPLVAGTSLVVFTVR